MKIRKPTTRLVDIGPLDFTKPLPTAGRIRAGMKTICDRCGKPITDELFIVGFKAGMPNMKFHADCVEGKAGKEGDK